MSGERGQWFDRCRARSDGVAGRRSQSGRARAAVELDWLAERRKSGKGACERGAGDGEAGEVAKGALFSITVGPRWSL